MDRKVRKSPPRVEVTRVKFQHGIHDQVLQHLNKGQPILMPTPSPLPYVVVARDPETVNAVKGRPRETATCRMIGSFDDIEDIVALNKDARETAKHYLTKERMTILLPILAWLVEDSSNVMDYDVQASPEKFRQTSPTVRSKAVKADLCRRPSAEFRNPYALFHHSVVMRNKPEFCSKENRLYVSSGNVSGCDFQQSFDKIVKQFELYGKPDKNFHLLALDADHLRFDGFHESTSMVRVTERGDVKTTRVGIHHHPPYAKSKCWRMKTSELHKWDCLAETEDDEIEIEC